MCIWVIQPFACGFENICFNVHLLLDSSVLSKRQLGSGFQSAVGTAVQTIHCEFAAICVVTELIHEHDGSVCRLLTVVLFI